MTEYQHDAEMSSLRVAALPLVFLVVLVLAGCALSTVRGLREIERKEIQRARMEREMKPPLPESGLAIWWAENGKAAMGIAAALLGAGGLANRVKG